MKLKHDTDQAVDFLLQFRGDSIIVVTAIIPDGPTETRSFERSEADAIREFIDRLQGKKNLFYSVNPVRRRISRKAKKEDIEALNWLHVDIDPEDGEDLITERARIREVLKTFQISPNVIIDSGGGYQAFWRLKEPIPVDNNIAELESYNKRLELALGADNCSNIDRIMRSPGTINLPTKTKFQKGRKPALASLVHWDDNSYELSDFEGLETAPSEKPLKPPVTHDSEGLPDRFLGLLTTDPKLRSRWEGDTSGLNDTSRSGMDMSLTSLLRHRHFSPDEINEIV